MTLQNRVDPWGRLHAVEARGFLMGNRGTLHDAQRHVVRSSQRSAWVTCTVEFGGRRREVFGQSTYSELFFLDETTAFSAGHRPCAACRRDRYAEFKAAWLSANSAHFSLASESMTDIDKLLHQERNDRRGAKTTFQAALTSLPLGAFVDINNEALLVSRNGLMRWSFAGYSRLQVQPSPATQVRVLTPESVTRVFAAGFRPLLHQSAYT